MIDEPDKVDYHFHFEQISCLKISEIQKKFSFSLIFKQKIALMLERKADRTDYLCEMKFTGGKYAITKNDEEEFLKR